MQPCYRKLVIFYFCFAYGVSFAWLPAAKDSSVAAELTQQFVGKSFQLKIKIGSFINGGTMQNGQQCLRLIDTEYRLDRTIRYQGRRGCFSSGGDLLGDLFSSNFYVEPERLTGALAPGVSVAVVKLESKEDRIELWLNAVPNTGTVSSYGKLKLYLPKGVSASDAMALASHAFHIEKYERLATLESDYQQLSSTLQNLQAQYSASQGPNQKIALAHQLQTTYRSMAENRRNLAAASGTNTTINTRQPEIEALDRDVAGLQNAAREQRIQQLQDQLNANRAQRAELRSQLQQPVKTAADLQQKQELVDRDMGLLEAGQGLVGQLSQEGKPAPALADEITTERETLGKVSAGFSTDRKRLQLAQLNNEFHEMEKRRIRLIGVYTQSAGTPQQHAALQAVIAELEAMLHNRSAARGLGYEAATKQITQIESELASLSKNLAVS